MPKRRVAVAGHGEDLAGLAQQVERHQDQYERDQHREAAGQEQPHHVEGKVARRKEGQIDHVMLSAVRRPGMALAVLRTYLAVFAAKRSSAPMGWPPGWCAST